MGHDDKSNSQSHTVEIPESGGVRQSKLAPLGTTIDFLYNDAKTCIEALQRGYTVSGNGPCYGWREGNSEYQWLTYGEVIEKAKNISAGLISIGMKPGQNTFVCIYGRNCVEWILSDFACSFQSVITAPIYDTLGPKACPFIINKVEAEIVIVDTEDKARRLLDLKEDIPTLRHIVIMKDVSSETKMDFKDKSIFLHQLKDLEEIGKRNKISYMIPKPSDIMTICFTSGTTSEPKGVRIAHSGILADTSGFLIHTKSMYLVPGSKLISYLPLAHIYERANHIVMLCTGGCIGFFRGDITLLLDDIQALKPGTFPAVPRVLNKVYDKVQAEAAKSKIKKFLLDTAIRAKTAELRKGIHRDNSIWDLLVLKKIRNVFGGKVRLTTVGGAPIRSEVLTFFRCVLGGEVLLAYGQTEASAAITLSICGDSSTDNVGVPLPCFHVKLIDCSELGYFASENKGEILVKGPGVAKGYLKDSVGTMETFDKDGWLHTGDIGEWLQDGTLAIIDRKKNIIKLSQGEFVALEAIEAVYLRSLYVEQIYVHGDSLQNFLVAIIVPNKDAVEMWCNERDICGDWQSLCKHHMVKKLIMKEFKELGIQHGLKGFEQVKAIHLHPDPFTVENNILTATMKTKRRAIKEKFENEIQSLFNSLK